MTLLTAAASATAVALYAGARKRAPAGTQAPIRTRHKKLRVGDLPVPELRLEPAAVLDTGHFALETHVDVIARLMRDFLGRHATRRHVRTQTDLAPAVQRAS